MRRLAVGTDEWSVEAESNGSFRECRNERYNCSRMFPNLERSYTIAFTPRSGSNALCELLARNGMGAPSEWFQRPPISQLGKSGISVFVSVVNEHQSHNTFACKLGHDHRARLDEYLRCHLPGYRRLDDILPAHRWVWLLRRDKILQAISLCRAETSGGWSATEPGKQVAGDFEYDFFHILSRLMIIHAGECAWKVYFEEYGIEPFILVYEDFFQNMKAEFSKLIVYLGGLPAGRSEIRLDQSFVVQRDEKSYQMGHRFIRDLQRVGEEGFALEMGERVKRWESFFFERQWRGTDPT